MDLYSEKNRKLLSPVIDKLLPARTRRRRIIAKIARKFHLLPQLPPNLDYAEWIERTEPFLWTNPKTINLTYKPLMSIIVPVFNPPARHFLPMVYSVVNQEYYDNWELVLINASTAKASHELTKQCEQIDTRIKVIDIARNEGIAQNTNFGIKNCQGEYIALLDHDDVLAPRALFEVAIALQSSIRPQIIYSDEDKITEDGKYRFDVHFKPDWSPQLLRQVNYLNHLTVIEKKLLNEVNGYRTGFDGAQDYDLFLRLADKKPVIKHVPLVLYHWRAAQTSTASNISTKKNVHNSGKKALEDHLIRSKHNGRVEPINNQPGFYNIFYRVSPKAKIAVLLMPTNNLEQYYLLTQQIVKSLEETSVKTELILGPTLKTIRTKNHALSLTSINTTNHQDYISSALEQSDANILIFLNASAVPKNPKWLENLSGLVDQVNSIGVAAPLLTKPIGNNDTIFDAGFVSHAEADIMLFQGSKIDKNTYFGNTLWSRNVDYISGRVCALKRDIFKKYFNEQPFYNPDSYINKRPYDKMRRDNLEVVVCSNIKMEYRGELFPPRLKSKFYNPNLTIYSGKIELSKNINVPPVELEENDS